MTTPQPCVTMADALGAMKGLSLKRTAANCGGWIAMCSVWLGVLEQCIKCMQEVRVHNCVVEPSLSPGCLLGIRLHWQDVPMCCCCCGSCGCGGCDFTLCRLWPDMPCLFSRGRLLGWQTSSTSATAVTLLHFVNNRMVMRGVLG
jgi:hypothetical protein